MRFLRLTFGFVGSTRKVEYVKVYIHKMSGGRTLSEIEVSGIVGIRIRDRSSCFYAVHNYSVAIQRLCFIYTQDPNGQRIRVRGEWLQIAVLRARIRGT